MISFSVVMSVYEKEKSAYVKESIESILFQSYAPAEFIIVCDGPLTSELNETLIHFQEIDDRIKIIRLKQNHGLWYALNIGIEHCSYEIIARMDSDDISDKDRFAKQIPYMEKGYDLIGSNVIEFDEDGFHSERRVPESKKEIIKFSKYRNPFNHPSVIYRKSIIQKVGGYKSFYRLDDYTLWIDLLRIDNLKMKNIQENLVYMRVTNTSYERRSGKTLFSSLYQLRKYMLKHHDIGYVTFLISIIFQSGLLMCTPAMKPMIYKMFFRRKKV